MRLGFRLRPAAEFGLRRRGVLALGGQALSQLVEMAPEVVEVVDGEIAQRPLPAQLRVRGEAGVHCGPLAHRIEVTAQAAGLRDE